MCGRFNLRTDPREFAEIFRVASEFDYDWQPRYNIAPIQNVVAIRDADQREFFMPRWGLIPTDEEDDKGALKCINARSENVNTRPQFRFAFQKRRCLIIASGFYEWRKVDKIPHFISLKSGALMPFAGLWETWTGPAGPVESCTICTINANKLMRKLQDRMPVILAMEDIDLWLNPKITDPKKIKPLLRQYEGNDMQSWEISKAVGNLKNQGPELMEPIDRPRTLKFQ